MSVKHAHLDPALLAQWCPHGSNGRPVAGGAEHAGGSGAPEGGFRDALEGSWGAQGGARQDLTQYRRPDPFTQAADISDLCILTGTWQLHNAHTIADLLRFWFQLMSLDTDQQGIYLFNGSHDSTKELWETSVEPGRKGSVTPTF